MRSSALDKRVRKEATYLVREARAALSVKSNLRGTAGELEPATTAVEQALAVKDYRRVRRGMPTLDALIDELVKRPPKSTTRDFVESIGAAVLIAFALRAFVVEAFKIPSSSMYPTLEIGDHIFVNKFIYGIRIPWTRSKLFELRAPKRGEVIVFQWPCDLEKDYIKRVVALPGDSVEVRCDRVYVNGQAIESKLIDPAATYEDRVGDGENWNLETTALYRETVNGFDYSTYYDTDRVDWERMLAAGDADAGESLSVQQGWPDPSDPPRCGSHGTVRPPVGEEQTLGQIIDVEEKQVEGLPYGCRLRQAYVVPAGHIFAMGDNRDNSNDSRGWGSVPIRNIKGKALFMWLSYKDWSPFHWSGMRWRRIGHFVH